MYLLRLGQVLFFGGQPFGSFCGCRASGEQKAVAITEVALRATSPVALLSSAGAERSSEYAKPWSQYGSRAFRLADGHKGTLIRFSLRTSAQKDRPHVFHGAI